MSRFARIFNGIVMETITFNPDGMFHPSLLWVDCSATPGVTQGWLYGNGTFSAPPAAAAPSLAAQAAARISAGLQITSTSTPTLNGTYSVDGIAQGRIAAISTYILVNGKFPRSQTSYSWMDLAEQPHVFTQTAQFQAFATAIADYVAALDEIILTNSGALPATTAPIP